MNLGLIIIVGVEVSEVCVGIGFPGKLGVEVLISFLQDQIVFVEGLNGFHGVVFVQFIDVIGDAGVEWRGRDGVDDGGVVGLLLITLAVRVHQQGNQAAENGAAEPHGDHVEEVEISTSPLLLTRACNGDFWYKIGVRRAWPGLAAVSRALVSSGKQDITVTHTQLGPVGVTVGPLGPAGPTLWTGLSVAQCFFSVQAQADVPSVSWWGVAAGSCPHVVSSSTRHRALGP